jgi:tetratricopeptide (TPR) repeat protein
LKRNLLLVLILCLGGFWSGQTCASTDSAKTHLSEGYRLYGEGKFGEAAAAFEKAAEADGRYLAQYNLGTARVKAGDFEGAVDALQQALLTDAPDLRAKAQYNLGNALYRYGISKEDTDIDVAIRNLEEALGHYDRVHSRVPGQDTEHDPDLAHNRAFVEEELERLRKKKEDMQQQGESEESGESGDSGESKDSPDSGDGKNEQDEQPPDSGNEKRDGDGQQSPPGQPPQQPPASDSPPPDGQSGSDGQDGSEGGGQQPPPQEPPPSDEEEPGDGQGEPDAPQDPGPGSGDSGQSKDAPAKPRPSNAQGAPSSDAKDKALRMLENYKNTEEPQGVMMFIPRGSSDDPVEQDW